MRKLIRLTESDLHRIVKESVNRIIKEKYELPDGNYKLPGGNFDSYAYNYDDAIKNADSVEDWDNRMKRRENMSKLSGSLASDFHPQTERSASYNRFYNKPSGSAMSYVYTHNKDLFDAIKNGNYIKESNSISLNTGNEYDENNLFHPEWNDEDWENYAKATDSEIEDFVNSLSEEELMKAEEAIRKAFGKFMQ